jgi:dTMP kinase
MLAETLKAKGHEVVLTAEPGGTGIGKSIRSLIMDLNNTHLHPVTELLLYGADRRQHIEELISPSLESGKVVITDRYSDSTHAYQGIARGLGNELVDALDQIATGGLKPHLTLLLDLDPEEGIRRNREKGKIDRFELEDLSFHRSVRKGFLAIQTAESERVRLIDASQSIEDVHAAIMAEVEEHMKKAQAS